MNVITFMKYILTILKSSKEKIYQINFLHNTAISQP